MGKAAINACTPCSMQNAKVTTTTRTTDGTAELRAGMKRHDNAPLTSPVHQCVWQFGKKKALLTTSDSKDLNTKALRVLLGRLV